MGVATAVELVEMEDQAQAARFREISAKVAQDVAAMTTFNAAQDESTRRSHVVNVMHQKAQMSVGKQQRVCIWLFKGLVLFCQLSSASPPTQPNVQL